MSTLGGTPTGCPTLASRAEAGATRPFAVWSLNMAHRSAMELRKQAKDFREMAVHVADREFRAALLMLADDFDQEATEMEGAEASKPQPER
jgi:hypothetical protein